MNQPRKIFLGLIQYFLTHGCSGRVFFPQNFQKCSLSCAGYVKHCQHCLQNCICMMIFGAPGMSPNFQFPLSGKVMFLNSLFVIYVHILVHISAYFNAYFHWHPSTSPIPGVYFAACIWSPRGPRVFSPQCVGYSFFQKALNTRTK